MEMYWGRRNAIIFVPVEMTTEKSRKLAAIMFTDMVGYTALMQTDEHKAKSNRDRHRKILQDSVAEHKGNILQYFGDGTLIIFNSALEAVDCAIQIQMELQKEPKIPLRIGIHTGDIVYDDEGVYGDGVNVASRIERLSVGGSVLISGTVHDYVKNHKAISTAFLGTFDLKNVTKPMDVYAIANEGLNVPTEFQVKAKPQDLKKSLAVLPFVNMSSDPENEYFSDGITEELLNVLAQEPGLRVTARTSSFAFKDQNRDIKQIGEQLGAKSILEGSVRKSGKKIRITAQLINAVDGYHIWSETFDRELEDVFAVQDEISQKISNRLREKLTLEPEKVKAGKPQTRNMEAYEIYLKGMFHANKWTHEDAEIAIKEFHRAIELEPDFALPYSWLSSVHIYLGASGKVAADEAFIRAKEYADKAIQLDNNAAESYEALANVCIYYEWNWEEAFRLLERAIEINPSYAGAYLTKALLLAIHGRYDEAIETMKKSIQLDPFFPPGLFAYASILLFANRLEESMAQLDTLFKITPDFSDALFLKGFAHQLRGEYDEALDIFMKVKELPGSRVMADANLGALYVKIDMKSKSLAILEKLLDAQRRATDPRLPMAIATIYAALDKPDEMFDYLNLSAELKDNNIIYILGQLPFNKYRSDPRFTNLVKKIGIWK
jgi:TolB-like protein/class 3 adenylate cyclase/tetratricopeptide (TPR) repeat protein